jgi:predicted RNA-binding Zn-ribbon protein involved in translation (DUF1610 family)
MSSQRGKLCSSCGKLSVEYVEFKCPGCLQEVIVRDMRCRENHTRYRCSKCGTEGP